MTSKRPCRVAVALLPVVLAICLAIGCCGKKQENRPAPSVCYGYEQDVRQFDKDYETTGQRLMPQYKSWVDEAFAWSRTHSDYALLIEMANYSVYLILPYSPPRNLSTS